MCLVEYVLHGYLTVLQLSYSFLRVGGSSESTDNLQCLYVLMCVCLYKRITDNEILVKVIGWGYILIIHNILSHQS